MQPHGVQKDIIPCKVEIITVRGRNTGVVIQDHLRGFSPMDAESGSMLTWFEMLL